jgi:hypothetical protein
MYVAGLIPYLQSIDKWYLNQFTEDAKSSHVALVWDPNSNQIFSMNERVSQTIYMKMVI